LARLLRGVAPLVQANRERTQPIEWVRRRVRDRGEVVGRFVHGLFEQREEELVLAVEVLVERAQRLLRPIDDLLDRELGGALLVDERKRGVEKTLHALLGARAGRVQTPGDR